MPTLATYTLQTRRLLHDATGQYFGTSQDPNELTDYINAARNRLVRDTGCYRVLQIAPITAGQEAYSFNTGGVTGVQVLSSNNLFTTVPNVVFTSQSGDIGAGAAGTAIMSGTAPNLTLVSVQMTNSGENYTLPPTVSFTGSGTATGTAGVISFGTFDILNVTLQWGDVRAGLDYMPFTQFNRDIRGLMQYTQRPTTWSKYGQNTVYLGPVPDQMYVVEFDTVMLPPPLVNQTDVDAILPQYTDPIPFYAAFLAKYKEADMEEAARFKEEYRLQALQAIGSSFTRTIPRQYAAG